MTEYSFKNGITIYIPNDIPNLIEEWIDVKMQMSLILDPPPAADPIPQRKQYTFKDRIAVQLKRKNKK